MCEKYFFLVSIEKIGLMRADLKMFQNFLDIWCRTADNFFVWKLQENLNCGEMSKGLNNRFWILKQNFNIKFEFYLLFDPISIQICYL